MNDFDEQATRRLRRLVAGLPTHPVPGLPAVRSSRLAGLPRVVGAAVAVAVVVAAVGIGLFVSGRLPVGNGISADDGAFHGGGISFRYPREWTAHAATAVGSFGSVFAVLGSADLRECAGLGGIDVNCAYAGPLAPGTLRLVVGTGGRPNFSMLDRKPPTGWGLFVDGLPAVVQSSGPNSIDGSDVSLTWAISRPGSVDNF